MKLSFRVILFSILLVSFVCGRNRVSRKKRSTVGAAIGNRGAPPKRKPPPDVIPPIPLGPGETTERAPGWKCVKNMRVGLKWKNFKSPGYPKFQESQIQCTWIIEAPIGMKVKLAFRDLDMHGYKDACGKQFVQLIDSKIGKSQGRFCGATVPNDYVSSGNLLRLDLQGDKTVKTYRGFSANVIAVKEIAGFRKTRTYGPPPGSAAPGGKVNLQQFSSQNEGVTTPPIRGNRKLIYESDLPRTTTTEAAPGNEGVPTNEGGWLAQGGIANQQGFTIVPTRNPALVPLGNRNNVPKNQAGSSSSSSSSVKFVPTNKKPPIRDTDEVETVEEGGYIDPSFFESNFDSHVVVPSGKKGGLSTTTLIIIVASCAGFVILLLMLVGFCWLRRKRNRNKKSNETQNKPPATPQANQQTSESIRMKEMEARQSALPGLTQTNPHYPRSHHQPSRQMSRHAIDGRPASYMPPPGTASPWHGAPQQMPPTESHMSQRYQHYQRAEDFGRQQQHGGSLGHAQQHPMQRTRSGRALPPVPNHGVQNDATGYYSDSNDEVEGKTLRREYSEWELKKMKSDRRSKLIAGS